MANIDIQRKEGPGMWPWLIGALALVLVIWAVVEFTGNDTARGTADPAAEQAPVETYPPAPGAADPYAPGTVDPYGPTTPASPGTDPAAPTTDPRMDQTEIQRETPGMTRDPNAPATTGTQPPSGGQPNGAQARP